MRIAIVNKFFFRKGGQETVALEQMRLLEEAGHEVAFFSMHHPKNPANYYWSKYFVDFADFSLQAPLSFPQKLALATRFIVNTEAAKKFDAFLQEFKPDIIHCHGIAHQLTYTILPIARKYKIPVVQTLHDYQIICPSYTLLKGDNSICGLECSKNNYLPSIQNRCVKGSIAASLLSSLEMVINRGLFDYTPAVSHFISPSRFLVDQVIQSGITESKVLHIPNFLVELDAITPRFENNGKFLYIGRLSYEKGLITLLKAFQQTPEAELLIAGDGPLKDQVLSFCQEHQLDNVTLLGHLNPTELQTIVADTLAVIVPSEWYENQPMTIIEAFAYGKPVIASNLGGIPEMVLDGENGFLFEPGNMGALVAIIQKLLSSPELGATLGQNARQFALQNHHAVQHLNKLMDVYTTLTA